MPLIIHKQPDKNTSLGVWQITETVDQLVGSVVLSESEKEVLATFKHDKSKKHWLSYRALLQQLLGEAVSVQYTYFGKPYLYNEKQRQHVSITHSGDYSAVIINPHTSVGIDIEEVSRRIERVAPRFLSEEELLFMDKNSFLEHLTICWTAKEALFKISGNDYYDFREQIKLLPFDFSHQGTIRAVLSGENNRADVRLQFEKIEDYYLSYVVC
ncbi:MAG TPA: 4'-phosphopantetheinyl transferase superfamily protein [Bacteroidales bacterium]|nr:4'-phosphopantetheinyl transferase superfamily protein [Bacteroidales bacterium]